MVEFVYNNAINIIIGYSFFKTLLGYSLDFYYRIKVDPSRSILAIIVRIKKL